LPVDESDFESPLFQLFDKVLKGITILSENKKPFIALVEEPLFLKKSSQLCKLCLGAAFFDTPCFLGKLLQFSNFLLDVIGVVCETDPEFPVV